MHRESHEHPQHEDRLMRFLHPANLLIHLLLKALCRIDSAELRSVPREGPIIIATNHINFLEIPVLYTRLLPRKIVGISKIESWDNPIFRYLANLWKTIPIRRFTADFAAFDSVVAALSRRRILAMAPEGTRSGSGRLQKANAGVILLAAESGAPILPVAHFGGERFWSNLRGIRRTRMQIRVGSAFTVRRSDITTKKAREKILEDVMKEIASLMPERYRGFYA